MNTLQRLLGRASPQQAILQVNLPTSVVTHDSIDEMELRDGVAESPTFRRATIEDAPRVPPRVESLPAIDFTTATPEEIKDWQEKARANKDAEENAPTYPFYPDLTADVFYSYHTHDRPTIVEAVDPSVSLHRRIIPKLTVTDEHAESRNVTRDDPNMARLATIATMRKLREVLDEELTEQMQEAAEFEQERERAQEAQQRVEDMRDEARGLHEEGEEIPGELVEAMRAAVQERQQAVQNAQTVADNPTPMSQSAAQGIAEAAQAGQEAIDAAKGMPAFGSGLGEGEPVYESAEQALSVAERWSQGELREIAEKFGRVSSDIRDKRAKRMVGGNDEIVDIQMGENLARTLPSELALLGDPDFEDEFLARYAGGELLEFSTVGEEHAGRGPCVIVLDGSYSMKGERNVFARAVAMALLHVMRLEKRDFACVEFTGGESTEAWEFLASEPLDGEKIIDMASHFFGGGTNPLSGVARAAKIIKEAPQFRKADCVIVGDGEASFGQEDKNLREQLREKGVRIFAIGVGGTFQYLNEYCEPDGFVVDVMDMELTDPAEATAQLATHIQ